jgi:hypothetical protein
MPVMIGVDPHKASHTAAALDEHGRLLGRQRIPATLDGYRLLRQWAGRWPDRAGYRAALERHLQRQLPGCRIERE